MKSLILFITLILTACSDNTDTGNPLVSLNFAPYSAGAMAQKTNTALSVQDLQMCIKRLRFKTENENTNPDPEIDEDNIDLNIGVLQISPAGTAVTNIKLPKGIYTRIEFDLKKDCADSVTSPSVVLDNDNDGGTPFETDETITIRFEGSVDLNSSRTLDLYINNIIQALDTVSASNQIKPTLESLSAVGTF